MHEPEKPRTPCQWCKHLAWKKDRRWCRLWVDWIPDESAEAGCEEYEELIPF